MTPQEIFDKAYIGVVTQGRKSDKGHKGCSYLTEDGLKCGVGHLLDAETAKIWDKYEDSSVGTIVMRDRPDSMVPSWMKVRSNLELLNSIQRAHDNSNGDKDFVFRFKWEMDGIAKENNLTIPEMST